MLLIASSFARASFPSVLSPCFSPFQSFHDGQGFGSHGHWPHSHPLLQGSGARRTEVTMSRESRMKGVLEMTARDSAFGAPEGPNHTRHSWTTLYCNTGPRPHAVHPQGADTVLCATRGNADHRSSSSSGQAFVLSPFHCSISFTAFSELTAQSRGSAGSPPEVFTGRSEL